MSESAPKKLHSKLGASGYHRWSECPGSVALCENIPKTSSIYADEGNKAHDIAANILMGNGPKEPVDEEMEEAITVYLNYISDLRAKGPEWESVEQKFDLSEYHPQLFGTADYVCYFSESKTLYVVDYKHGAGVPVEVTRSKQLMYYGLGALHKNKCPIETIILVIVQPRCYHKDGPIRAFVADAIDMLDFAAQLIDDAKATEVPNAPLKAGDHCRFCPAQPSCPAAEKQALAVVTGGFTNVETFDPDKLSKALSLVPQIKAWCESVNQFAYQQAMLGNVLPGFKLVDKRATRKWQENFNPEDWDTLGFEINEFYEAKLKSPAQVEKMMGKIGKSWTEKFTVKESSGKKLVPVNDDRDAIEVEPAFKIEA